jgi:hypothetical protein
VTGVALAKLGFEGNISLDWVTGNSTALPPKVAAAVAIIIYKVQ